MEEESSRHLLKAMTQKNTSGTDTAIARTPWYDVLRGHNITSVTVLPKTHNPNLSLRKCQINPN